ncbi:HAD hydrolase family protein [Bacillaceae bacterium Marseille-Q3522]|nr:HAD hydrolase family protein [Bacillaceae bacterium Marseille-Q3522]
MNKIKLIVLDVDGVLTDGRLYIGSDGSEWKAFHTLDGMGISLAHSAGLKTAIITGRKSQAVKTRAADLQIDYVYEGVHDKLSVLEEITADMGIGFEEVCYMGDDLNDIPVLAAAGLSFAPENATRFVKQYTDFVTRASGGNGAVREMIDYLLNQQYSEEELLQLFLKGKTKMVQ